VRDVLRPKFEPHWRKFRMGKSRLQLLFGHNCTRRMKFTFFAAFSEFIVKSATEWVK